MSKTRNRMFVCGNQGYVTSFQDVFLARAKGEGFFSTYLPVPERILDDTMFDKQTRESFVTDWKHLTWGTDKDILILGAKRKGDAATQTRWSELRYDFFTGDSPPWHAIENLAEEYAHLQFELISENEAADFDMHLAYRYGKEVKRKTTSCYKRSHGTMSERFHRKTGSGHNL